MYRNEQKAYGLFINAAGTIKNLTVTGKVTNVKWQAAGICAGGQPTIINCTNYADVTGYNMVGGIHDYLYKRIENCTNYGTIRMTGGSYAYGGFGGICGVTGNENAIIINSTNHGNISGGGGICGVINTGGATIDGCINEGIAQGGIVKHVRTGTSTIKNCINLGACNNGIVNAYTGPSWNDDLSLSIYNCYNLGDVSNSGILGSQGGSYASSVLNVNNCYNAGTSTKGIFGTKENYSNTFNITNTYYDTSKSETIGAWTEGITGMTTEEIKSETFKNTLNTNIGNNTDWLSWKLGEDGYPTLDFDSNNT